MNYYAEELESADDVAYIAVVGPFEAEPIDELIERVGRIQEASPGKDKLVLDVRGVTGLKAEHYDLLENLRDRLRNLGWSLYFCNIPTQFKDFFNSGRMQRNFQVFDGKSELIQHFSDDGQTNKSVGAEREPIPVVLRTSSSIRLFKGVATDLNGDILKIWTKDHNARTISERDDLNPNLYFDTDLIQVVPKTISLHSFQEVDDPDWNYRIEVRLNEMDELDHEQVREYFGEP